MPQPRPITVDVARFRRDGYMVFPGLIPAPYCDAAALAIARHQGVELPDPATWYAGTNSSGHGIVPLHHDQSLWDIRQLPELHDIFAQLYGRTDLWVSIDRGSFKPPAASSPTPPKAAPIHWDANPLDYVSTSGADGDHHTEAAPMGVQGVIYLSDTEVSQGCFTLAPELYRALPAWLAQNPSPEQLRQPEVAATDIKPIPGAKGTLILWHRLMPHSSALNLHDSAARITQYVAMQPAGNEEARHRFAQLTKERRAPDWALRQKVPGQQNPEPGPPVVLSALGRKLAGLDPWPIAASVSTC